PGAPTTAQALEPNAPVAADQRASVQGELSFHESWSAMRGGGGQRAAHLLASTVTGDLLPGLKGGAIQAGAGLAVQFAAQKIPVPGVANIAGGVFSGIWLFGGGGAQAAGDVGQGLTAIFGGEGMGPWQRAADIVQMVKSLLDLIGHICNVLSGLAYAFAAIAALGGLLSVFCPALAFLVPYIPTAINFGRMCGGVASVCIGISSLISPIPPILRAIHIITSNDDPIQLVQQEQQYHQQMQGAIANYTSAGITAGVQRGAATQGTMGQRIAAGARAGLNPANQVGNMVSGIRGGAQTARSAGGDLRAGSPQAREAFGMQGQTNQQIRQDGALHGEGYLRGTAGQVRQQGVDRTQRDLNQRRERLEQVQGEGRRGATRRTQAQVNRLEGELEQRQGLANVAQGRDVEGGFQGESGDAFGNAYGTLTESPNPTPGAPQQPPAMQRDERGHVVLPEPPGSLEEIDGIDQSIEGLQARLRAQQENTSSAESHQQEAQASAQSLGALQQEVTSHQTEMAGTATEHQRVSTENQNARTQTDQQNSGSQGGMTRAAEVLRPISGPLNTVNGVVQRVPSNRFFNVSGTQRNLSEFVQGVNQITGTGEQNQQQAQAAQGVLQQRDTQVQQAQQQAQANQSEGQTFAGQVQTDQAATTQVAANAGQQAQASRGAEQTLEQQIQQKRAEKQQKWGALMSWAQQHYAIRTAAAQRR
ncbi:MAG: hypothetical protein KC620_18805, partial [Myxococcales bacterium]|nr:hypothetical protein [Myxococcales bacterium]